MDITPVTLEGRVVRLEPLATHHAGDLAAVATPDVFRYTFPPDELTAAGFEALIFQLTAQPNWCAFAKVHRATGRAIGATCYLDISAVDRAVEIGFTWIAKPFQGTPVNPESKYLLLRHAFERGAVRVQLKTDARNRHSQRAIEKLGAVREGVLRKHKRMPDGFMRDSVIYSITDEEWPAVRETLEARLGYAP